MTETRTKPALAGVALIAGLALLPAPSRADPAAPGNSDYRLNVTQSDYRVQVDPKYQLASEYRRPEPKADAPAAAQPNARRPLPIELERKPFAREILQAAADASVDPALVHAVIHVESGYRHEAISPKGALGLMQVMPGTAARYGANAAKLNAKKNLNVGTRYLRDLMGMFNDRLDLVLAAYNAGEGAVRRYSDKIPPYPETQSYVRAVLAKYVELGGIVPLRPAGKHVAKAGARLAGAD
jgi:soluble lytic murein transglycosylase-like protein